jgi:acyl-CoA synthetase (AMP-forming)/AMP-acid ligase II
MTAGAAVAGPFPDDVIEVSFTSGTTSTLKGVVFDNASYLFATRTLVDHYRLTASDVVYAVCPLFHATGMRCGLAPGLVAGGHVVIAPGFHPRTFWEGVARWKATFTALVDTMLIILLRQETSECEAWCRTRRTPSGTRRTCQEVKAIVVPVPGRSIQPEALWAWCADHLADFKVPRYVEIRPGLPRNATGKIVKARLKEEQPGTVHAIFDRLDAGPRSVRH